jgi:hypothetical protein
MGKKEGSHSRNYEMLKWAGTGHWARKELKGIQTGKKK